MSQPPVIGITGRARSGKDTVASFLLAAIGGYQYAFADPIRAMLQPLGIDMRDPYWQKHKEDVIPALGVSPRHLMQTLGTEWGRELIHPEIWLLLAKQRLLRMGPGMIISDVRFDNEAEWIRSIGGRIIHVRRKTATPVNQHVSENGVTLDPTDLVINNDGDLEDLQAQVRDLFHVD